MAQYPAVASDPRGTAEMGPYGSGGQQPYSSAPANLNQEQYPVAPSPYDKSVKTQTGSTTGYFIDPLGKYVVRHQGAFAAVEVVVSKEDGDTSVKTAGGAMVSMHNNVDFRIEMEGGLGGALCRACCAGGSFFFSHFFIKPELEAGTRGDVLLAPSVPGEILLLHLAGNNPDETWLMEKGSFLACDDSVAIGVERQAVVSGCFGGEGIFVLKASGQGRLVMSSYGSIIRYDLGPGEVRKIDNGALVAWQGHLKYTVKKGSRSILASIFSGEGFVTSFTGPGIVYAQTRSLKGLADAIVPYLPVSSAGSGSGAAGAAASMGA